MKIEFIPANRETSVWIPSPKPAKTFIPDWYKDIKTDKDIEFTHNGQTIDKTGGIKRCMPFLDALTTGYIQESWTDIYIKNDNGNILFSYPVIPPIMEARPNKVINISDVFYPTEFIWKMQWVPKLPKGWSVMITHPLNRLDLPFKCLTGIIDSDHYSHVGMTGGNYPFYIEKGFEGIIPAGTPMYQIIPFKRENWKSEEAKYDQDLSFKKSSQIRKHMFNGYKKEFWQKKSYE